MRQVSTHTDEREQITGVPFVVLHGEKLFANTLHLAPGWEEDGHSHQPQQDKILSGKGAAEDN